MKVLLTNFPTFYLVQVNVGSYLQLLCLAEGTRTDPQDVRNLLTINGCDIRQSLLQLQFWTRSAGGRHLTRPPACMDSCGKKTGLEGALYSCSHRLKGTLMRGVKLE